MNHRISALLLAVLLCSTSANADPYSEGVGGIAPGAPWREAGLAEVQCTALSRLPMLNPPERLCTFRFTSPQTFAGRPLKPQASVTLKADQVVSLSVSMDVPRAEQQAFSGWMASLAGATRLRLMAEPGEALLVEPSLRPGVARTEVARSRAILIVAKPQSNEAELHLGSFEVLQAVSELGRR